MADLRIIQIKGRAVVVPGHDIDTDRIMPARYLKCITFEALGGVIFQDERFTPDGKPKGHPLDDPRRQGARILVVGKNFGCGSSREHAPQGLYRAGFRALVGESFAEIFAGNCAAIGLAAVTVSEGDMGRLAGHVNGNPASEVVVDIEKKEVLFGAERISLDIRDSARVNFLNGTWDSTAALLEGREETARRAAQIPYVNWEGASV